MDQNKKGLNTVCTHTGEVVDEVYKGVVSPLYMSTSYAFEGVDRKRYPRYFNTPNQEGLSKKIAALEHAEAAMIFGSGMAAISTAMLAFLKAGDHVVLQKMLYGGTYALVTEQFERYGIAYTFTDGIAPENFESAIKPNTRIIYLETPSNPLLTITDMQAVSNLARKHGILTLIDNTFASPVNQNPIDFGIDVVIHSATKYMGGHSDILAGAVASSRHHMDRISHLARSLGGSLSDYTVWLLERSIKTMGIRVRAQNENAGKIAHFLALHPDIETVYYPGLEDHPGHEIARNQMSGYGGMVSFELKEDLDATKFQNSLRLVKSAMSLAGIESTILSPAKTSHALLPPEERKKLNIRDGLLRFSLGIEDYEDLKADLAQALKKVKGKMEISS